jgi:hypothetical protein
MTGPVSVRYRHIIGDAEVLPLYDSLDEELSHPVMSKAGVLPLYIPETGPVRFYVMQPQSSYPDLGPPEFQIAKGTRRMRVSGKWRDISSRDFPITDLSRAEDLLMTAMREGKEEIGLRTENIRRLFWGKRFAFASATQGFERSMMLFVVEVHHPDHFDEPDAYSAKTAARRWLTLAECQELTRPDHRAIVEALVERLCALNHLDTSRLEG